MSKTFIFFDLETTGLITYNNMPKITELSLIAVSRNAISDTTKPLPRVLSKLVLPINPNKHIPQIVAEITGLSNQDLENVKPFSCETYDMITNFINRLAPPVCFVAYNGDLFDYLIFLKELEDIRMNISEDILCIDMLRLIRNLYSSKNSSSKKRVIQANTSTFHNTIDMDKMVQDKLSGVDDTSSCSSHNNEMQRTDETTPPSQMIKHSSILLNINDNKRKRKFDFVNNKPRNFKLTTLYEHICGTEPMNAHSAEADCLFMIECAVQIKNDFLEWADSNAVPMISLKK